MSSREIIKISFLGPLAIPIFVTAGLTYLTINLIADIVIKEECKKQETHNELRIGLEESFEKAIKEYEKEIDYRTYNVVSIEELRNTTRELLLKYTINDAFFMNINQNMRDVTDEFNESCKRFMYKIVRERIKYEEADERAKRVLNEINEIIEKNEKENNYKELNEELEKFRITLNKIKEKEGAEKNHLIISSKIELEQIIKKYNLENNRIESNVKIIEDKINNIKTATAFIKEIGWCKENIAKIKESDSINNVDNLLERTLARIYEIERLSDLNANLKSINEEEERGPLIKLDGKKDVSYFEIEQENDYKTDFTKEIELFLEKIEIIDKRTFEKYNVIYKNNQGNGNLRLILENIKMGYLKIKESYEKTEVFRYYLKNTLSEGDTLNISDKLKMKVTALINEETINEQEYNSTIEELMSVILIEKERKYSEINKKVYLKSLAENLESLGYEVDSNDIGVRDGEMEEDKIVTFNMREHEYKLLAKIKSSEMVLRIAKNTENPTQGEYQEEKDKEIIQKWCLDFDKIYKKMEDNKFHTKILLKKEPEEEGILFLNKNKREEDNMKKSIMMV